jgi:hypothetical protein
MFDHLGGSFNVTISFMNDTNRSDTTERGKVGEFNNVTQYDYTIFF